MGNCSPGLSWPFLPLQSLLSAPAPPSCPIPSSLPPSSPPHQPLQPLLTASYPSSPPQPLLPATNLSSPSQPLLQPFQSLQPSSLPPGLPLHPAPLPASTPSSPPQPLPMGLQHTSMVLSFISSPHITVDTAQSRILLASSGVWNSFGCRGNFSWC